MGGLFGAKKAKTPPVPAPVPMPTEISPEVREKGEAQRRRMLAMLGRRGTILAGLGGTEQKLG